MADLTDVPVSVGIADLCQPYSKYPQEWPHLQIGTGQTESTAHVERADDNLYPSWHEAYGQKLVEPEVDTPPPRPSTGCPENRTANPGATTRSPDSTSLWHEVDGRFICDTENCNISFSRLPDLRRHFSNRHDPLSRFQFKCRASPLCKRAKIGFSRKDKRNDHERDAHKWTRLDQMKAVTQLSKLGEH